MICTHCGSAEVEEDRTRGDVTCTNCGAVLEENLIVNEVEFLENAGGAAAVVGQFVSSENQGGFRREPRKITEAKAKERIQIVCGQLRMNDDVVKAAFSFYQNALYRGMTRGRNVQVMTAACVYLAARLLRMNIMLLDLSDVVRINVYVLGRTYAEIKTRLRIVLPEMDPCLYIERFASKLELGDKTRQVSNTAMRILQRMKKDWISTGRKPSGLAASALLVAARMYEFNRTYEDVARIARISQQTARIRLEEFSRTASSALTIDEFLSVDYEEEADPPAFTDGIKRANASLMTDENLELIKAEMAELEKRIDEEMEKLMEKTRLKGPWAKYTRPDGSVAEGIRSLYSSCPASTSSQQLSEDAIAESYVLREALEGVVDTQFLDECVEDLHKVTSKMGLALISTSNENPPSPDPDAGMFKSHSTASLVSETDAMMQAAMVSISSTSKPADTAPQEDGNGELDLTGIDDEELEREYILSKREVIVKARTWFHENAEYISQMKKKDEEKKRKAEEENKNPTKKKVRRKRTALSPLRTGSASEAIDHLIQQKKLSDKINYAALKKLTNPTESIVTAPAPECSSTVPPIVTSSQAASNVKNEAVSLTSRLSSIKNESTLQQAPQSSGEPPSKVLKSEQAPSLPSTLRSPVKPLVRTPVSNPNLVQSSSSTSKTVAGTALNPGIVQKVDPNVEDVEDEDDIEDDEEEDIDELARRTQEEAANFDHDMDDYYDDY